MDVWTGKGYGPSKWVGWAILVPKKFSVGSSGLPATNLIPLEIRIQESSSSVRDNPFLLTSLDGPNIKVFGNRILHLFECCAFSH